MIAMPCLMFGQESKMKDFLDKYSDREGYTSVYISKFMFDMLRNVDIDIEDDEAEDILKNLNSIIILTKEGEAEDCFRNEMNKLLPKDNYQTLMRIKEDGQDVTFMAKEEKGRIKEFVMIVDAPEDPTLIYINGDITPEQLSNLSKTINIAGLEKLDSLEN